MIRTVAPDYNKLLIVNHWLWGTVPRSLSTWPFKRSPDALRLLIPSLAQKRPETF